MKRALYTWVAFTACSIVVFLAMGWLTVAALRLDRAQREARQQAASEEIVRLALWRMDSAVTTFIAKEGARPYFAYRAFYPAERAYTRMFAELRHGEVLVPSPLLDSSSDYVRLHFQFTPDGTLTSPEAPDGNMRDLAEAAYVSFERIQEMHATLESLRRRVVRDQLIAAYEHAPYRTLVAQADLSEPAADNVASQSRKGGKFVDSDFSARADQVAASNEFQTTKVMYKAQPLPQLQAEAQATSQMRTSPQQALAAPQRGPPATIDEEGMIPVWADAELFLVRRVLVDGQAYLQGCWLDWPGIQSWLLKRIEDLLPDAQLARAKPQTVEAERGRMMAALPVELIPGAIVNYLPDGSGAAPRRSPVRLALIVAWVCGVLSAAAIASLLAGTLSLSTRRGAFVSAVTHELRTPLTTFRMYTEMLVEGMVSDPEKRQRYLRTLHAESNRLTHLVENVLSYARLERGRAANQVASLSVEALLARMTEHLTQRATQSNMELIVSLPSGILSTTVRTNESAVEQILINLVDNACKYAGTASDRRILIEGRRTDGAVALRVRDHGPGIEPSHIKRLFRPFTKSAQEAANSAPGVGLGLALSRRLARSLGGDLALAPSDTGACFELTIPCV